jgi:hypothetical protein
MLLSSVRAYDENNPPSLLYHIQEVSVVNDLLEDGAKGEAIVPTECGRKAEDGYVCVFPSAGLFIRCLVRRANFWVKVGENTTVSGQCSETDGRVLEVYARRRCGVVGLVNDNGTSTRRDELH